MRDLNLEWGCDIDDMEHFITVSSPFYPDLEPYYDQLAHEWAGEKRRELREQEE